MSDDDKLIIHDGRQSTIAPGLQRCVCRMLWNAGHVSISEFQLASGRRADVLSIDKSGCKEFMTPACNRLTERVA